MRAFLFNLKDVPDCEENEGGDDGQVEKYEKDTIDDKLEGNLIYYSFT